MDTHGTTLYSWEAQEFKHHPKSFWWYLGLACLACALAVFQIYKQDFYGAAITGILAVLSAAFSRREPDIIETHITTTGIRVSDLHIPYKHIKHFWVVDDGIHKTLNIETTTYLNRHLILQLEDQDPGEIRDFLIQVIPEHDVPGPTFSQWISHKLKF